jgi:PAS domain S-box-containing protein
MTARFLLADIIDENCDGLITKVGDALPSTPASPSHRTIERLPVLVRDLVEWVRAGRTDEIAAPPVTFDVAVMMTALRVLKQSLYRLIDERKVSITPRDLRFINAWFAAVREAMLLAENRRYAALLDSIPNHLLIGNADGASIYVNQKTAATAEHVTGMSHHEVLGRMTDEIALDKNWGEYVGSCVKRAARGEFVSEDYLYPAPGGARWHEHTLRPVYGPNGKLEAIVTTGRDIDSRKKTEARFQLLSKFGALSDAMDPETVYDAMARLSIPEIADCCLINIVVHGRPDRASFAHGDPSQAALGRELLRRPSQLHTLRVGQAALAGHSTLITDIETREHTYLADSEIVRRLHVTSAMVVPFVVMGGTVAIATFMMTSDSKRRYVADDLVFAQEVAGRAAQVVENVQLHRQLLHSEARFRRALEHASICVFETDLELRVRWGYDSMFGIRGDMAVGRELAEMVGPEIKDRIDQLKVRVIETEAGERETVAAFVNGTQRHVLIRCEPLRDIGRVVGLIGAIIDVTEAKKAEKQIARELSFRERMMGVLAHDLRNPVSAVLGIAGLMRAQSSDEKTRQQLALIEQSARRMNEMIGTLLDFTRLRFHGSLPVTLTETDLDELARAVVAELQASHHAREIDLSISGNLRGKWDASRIAQLLTNLVANALTHGERGSPIWISFAGEEDEVLVTVSNLGAPIPPAHVEHLFDPFRQVDIDARRGLGLGLFIVREIARAHSGSVGVRSGNGRVTFAAKLPRSASPS